MVSNAGRRNEVTELLSAARDEWVAKGKDVVLKHYVAEEWALLALQGPKAAAALQPLLDIDLAQLRFMTSSLTAVDGHDRYFFRLLRLQNLNLFNFAGAELLGAGTRVKMDSKFASLRLFQCKLLYTFTSA